MNMCKTKDLFSSLVPFIRIFPGPVFQTDKTDLKAMIYFNPGLLLLRHGVILKKWHYYDFPIGKEMEKYLIFNFTGTIALCFTTS